MAERCAIVGAGLGGFVAYTTLRHGGLEPGEIAVFGDDPDPTAAWRVRAAAIRQERMRSESDGHCSPTTFPGLAAREAARRLDLAPLLQSVCNRYRPTVPEFLQSHRRAAGAGAAGTRASARHGSTMCARTATASLWTATAASVTSCSRQGIPGSRCRPSSRAIRASSTLTSRTSTPPRWP